MKLQLMDLWRRRRQRRRKRETRPRLLERLEPRMLLTTAPVATDDTFSLAHDQTAALDVLANDWDAESDPLTISLATPPAHGTASVVNGQVEYTPNGLYVGPDSFTYRANDGAQDSNEATVTLTVTNDTPTATSDFFTVESGTATSLDVLLNDVDDDGDTLSVTVLTPPSHGSVTVLASGAIEYVGNVSFGTDAFTYEVSDGIASSAPAVVSLVVQTVSGSSNSGEPTAVNDSLDLLVDTTATVDVLANDSDPDEDPLTILIDTPPTNGTVQVVSGAVEYTPSAGFLGSDSFTYLAHDGNTSSDSATVSVEVFPHAQPVAVDEWYRTPTDTTLVGADTRSNDSSNGLAPLTTVVNQDVQNGTLTLDNTTGDFDYTPNPGFEGADSFTYDLTDGVGTSTAEVYLCVGAGAAPDSYEFFVDTYGDTVVGSTRANDTTCWTAPTTELVSGTGRGNLTLGEATGDFTYSPTALGPSTNDSFTYRLHDGNLSTTAAVDICVVSATDDAFVYDPASQLNGTTRLNDFGASCAATTVVTAGPSFGSLSLDSSDGSFTYTPDPMNPMPDGFTYALQDAQGNASSEANVDLLPVDPAVDVSDVSWTVWHDSVAAQPTFSVLDGAVGSALEVYRFSGGTDHGYVELQYDGTFRYTPDPGYVGDDSFTFTAWNGLSSDTATVNVTVDNDIPVACDDPYALSPPPGSACEGLTTGPDENFDVPNNGAHSLTTPDFTLTTVLGNDVDVDPLSVEIDCEPEHGIFTLAPDGTLLYDPDPWFDSATAGKLDTLTYVASDGIAASIAEVRLDVGAAQPTELMPEGRSAELTAAWYSTLCNAVVPSQLYPLDTQLSDAITEYYGPVNGQQFTRVLDSNGVVVEVTDWNGNVFSALGGGMYQFGEGFVYIDEVDDELHHVEIGSINASIAGTIDWGDGTSSPAWTEVNTGLTHRTDENGDHEFLITGHIMAVGEHAYATPGPFEVIWTDTTQPANELYQRKPLGELDVVVQPAALSPLHTFTIHGAANDALVDVFLTNFQDGNLVDAPSTYTATIDWGDGSPTTTGQVVTSYTFDDYQWLGITGTHTYTARGEYAVDVTFSDKESQVVSKSGTAIIGTPPVANPDTFATSHTEILTVSAPGFLDNDISETGTRIGSLVDPPNHGVLVFSDDGTFEYHPTGNYVGQDAFEYEIRDEALTGNTAIVTIDVTNDAPVANNDSFFVGHDRTSALHVLFNDTDADGDPLTISIVDQPANGVVTVVDGFASYVPDDLFLGADSFTYRVNDGFVDSGIATASISVLNDGPIATEDTVTAAYNATTILDILANDLDGNNDWLSISIVQEPIHGGLTVQPDATVAYTPDADYEGPDQFLYQTSDGVASSATVAVDITVANAIPVANHDTYPVLHDQVTALNLTANDIDPDDQTLAIVIEQQPEFGTATVVGSVVEYTPGSSFTGGDSFSYRLNDGLAESDAATVVLHVTNDAPTAVTDPYQQTATRGTTLAGDVLDNIVDPDGDVLSTSVVRDPLDGTLTLNANGTFTYDAPSGFATRDGFAFDASDTIEVVEVTSAVTIDARPNVTPITVTVTHDTSNADGQTTLREAIEQANANPGPDIIEFLPFEDPFELEQVFPLDITSEIWIEGPAGNPITISVSGSNPSPQTLFNVSSSGVAALRDVVLVGGSVTSGSPGISNAGNLSLHRVTISGGSSTNDNGGAIYNTGVLRIDDSTLHGNTAQLGGGIYNDVSGTMSVVNSTISGNSASLDGGGIYNAGTMTLLNVTVAANSAAQGAGIYSSGTSELVNTLVATNTSASDVSGAFVSGGHNLVGDAAGSTGLDMSTNGDQVGGLGGEPVLDPVLGPLQDAGGGFLTHPLLVGSPAIDGGRNLGVFFETDQRGAPRILDGLDADDPYDAVATVDIGAFEFGTYFVNTTLDAVDATAHGDSLVDTDLATSGNQVSLRSAIQEFNALANWHNTANTIGGVLNSYILFEPTLDGPLDPTTQEPWLTLSLQGANENAAATGDLDVFANLTIHGNGRDTTIIRGGYDPFTPSGEDFGDRLVHALPGSRVHLEGVALTGGHVVYDNGGAVLNDGGSLTIVDAAIGTLTAGILAGSEAVNGGGVYSRGELTITDTQLDGNLALNTGGAIHVESGNALIENTQINYSITQTGIGERGGGIGVGEGTVEIRGTQILNAMAADGGGIFNERGTVTVTDNSRIYRDGPVQYGSYGGGIYNEGTLHVAGGTRIDTHGESTVTVGAGIYNAGVASLTDAFVEDNTAFSGGGIYNTRSGVLYVENSSISRNSADAGLGGGIHNDGGVVTLDGARLVDNFTAYMGAGVYNYDVDSVLTVRNSTFEGNSTVDAGGAGLMNDGGTVTVGNSTFASNVAFNDAAPSGGGAIMHLGTNRMLALATPATVVADLATAASIDPTDANILLVDDIAPFASLTIPFGLRLNNELMLVSGRHAGENGASDWFDVIRGQGGTSVIADNSGDAEYAITDTDDTIQVAETGWLSRFEVPFEIQISDPFRDGLALPNGAQLLGWERMRVTYIDHSNNVLHVDRGYDPGVPPRVTDRDATSDWELHWDRAAQDFTSWLPSTGQVNVVTKPTATTLSVSSTKLFDKYRLPLDVIVDDERMTVTAVDHDRSEITVIRGRDGTEAVEHFGLPAVWAVGGSLTVFGSTFSANVVGLQVDPEDPEVGFDYGGAIFNQLHPHVQPTVIANSTFTLNRADEGASIWTDTIASSAYSHVERAPSEALYEPYPYHNQAIWDFDNTDSLIIRNTIVDDGLPSHPDGASVRGVSGEARSEGNNVISLDRVFAAWVAEPSGITSTQTSFHVSEGVFFPAEVPFKIRVSQFDGEQYQVEEMMVTDFDGDERLLTVERGVNGTEAIDHPDYALVVVSATGFLHETDTFGTENHLDPLVVTTRDLDTSSLDATQQSEVSDFHKRAFRSLADLDYYVAEDYYHWRSEPTLIREPNGIVIGDNVFGVTDTVGLPDAPFNIRVTHDDGTSIQHEVMLVTGVDETNSAITVLRSTSQLAHPDGAAITVLAAHDRVDPMLGPLANHGGPTSTHLPLPGSPLLDRGDRAHFVHRTASTQIYLERGPIDTNGNDVYFGRLAQPLAAVAACGGCVQTQHIPAVGNFPPTPFVIHVGDEVMRITDVISDAEGLKLVAERAAFGTPAARAPSGTVYTVGFPIAATSGEQTIEVRDASVFPPAPFVMRVGTELMRVVDVDTDRHRLDVQRGVGGTTPVAHAAQRVGQVEHTFGSTFLLQPITASDSQVTVQVDTGVPTGVFEIQVGDEEMEVTAMSVAFGPTGQPESMTLTVTRGVNGTAASSHSSDAHVRYLSGDRIRKGIDVPLLTALSEAERIAVPMFVPSTTTTVLHSPLSEWDEPTTVSVEDTSQLPAAPFVVLVENELLLVTDVDIASGELSVERGIYGTTAVPHNLGTELVVGSPVDLDAVLHAQLALELSGLATNLEVIDTTSLPGTPFDARIGQEIVSVTNVDAASNTLTVIRGHKDTTAVPHAAGESLVVDSLADSLIAVPDVSIFPATPFIIRVDNELMRVTAKFAHSDRLRVERGVYRTRPVAHSSAALVEHGDVVAVSDASLLPAAPFELRAGLERVLVTDIDPLAGTLDIARAYRSTATLHSAGTLALHSFTGVEAHTQSVAISTDQAITVTAIPGLPQTSDFEIRLNHEEMRVTSVTRELDENGLVESYLLTVERGVNGTSAASHSANSVVRVLAAQRGSRASLTGSAADAWHGGWQGGLETTQFDAGTYDIGAAESLILSVNTTTDTAELLPGNGQMNTSVVTDVSLRAAIMEANAVPGHTTILLPAGDYPLSLAGMNEDGAATGDLDIATHITIVGEGADVTSINADSLDRVFDVLPGAALALSGVMVYGGSTTGNGGAIRVGENSSVSLQNSRISFSAGADGAGIWADTATIEIVGSSISTNTASGAGGGLYATNSTIEIRRSTISGNSANTGGGVAVDGNDSSLVISSSTITDNSAIDSGGIAGAGTVDIGNTIVAANTASGSDPDIGWPGSTDPAPAGLTSLGHNLIGVQAASGASLDEVDGIDESQTQFQVADASSFMPTPFDISLSYQDVDEYGMPITVDETMTVTAVNGNTLTVTRSITPNAFPDGTMVTDFFGSSTTLDDGLGVSVEQTEFRIADGSLLPPSTPFLTTITSTAGTEDLWVTSVVDDPVTTRATLTAQRGYNSTTAVAHGGDATVGTGGAAFSATGDIVGSDVAPLDPQLSTLTRIDSTTETHLPLAGSPAIDAGALLSWEGAVTTITDVAHNGVVQVGDTSNFPPTPFEVRIDSQIHTVISVRGRYITVDLSTPLSVIPGDALELVADQRGHTRHFGSGAEAVDIGSHELLPEFSVETLTPSVDLPQTGSVGIDIEITRTGNLDDVSTVRYTVIPDVDGGSAIPVGPADFVPGQGFPLPTDVVTFPAGSNSVTVTIDLAGTDVDSPDRGFAVALSEPTGARLTAATSGGGAEGTAGTNPTTPIIQVRNHGSVYHQWFAGTNIIPACVIPMEAHEVPPPGTAGAPAELFTQAFHWTIAGGAAIGSPSTGADTFLTHFGIPSTAQYADPNPPPTPQPTEMLTPCGLPAEDPPEDDDLIEELSAAQVRLLLDYSSKGGLEVDHTDTIAFNPIVLLNIPESVTVGSNADVVYEAQSNNSLGQQVNAHESTFTYVPLAELKTIPGKLTADTLPGGAPYRFSGTDQIEFTATLGGKLVGSATVDVLVRNDLPVLRGDRLHQPDAVEVTPEGGAFGIFYLDSPITSDYLEMHRVDLWNLFTDPDGEEDLRDLRITRFRHGEDVVDLSPSGSSTELAVPFKEDGTGPRLYIRPDGSEVTDGAGSPVLNASGDAVINAHALTIDSTQSLSSTDYLETLEFDVFVSDGQVREDGSLVEWIVRFVVIPRRDTNWTDVPNAWANEVPAPWNPLGDFTVTPFDVATSGIENVGGTAVDLFGGTIQRRHGLILDGSAGTSEMAIPGLVYDSAVVPQQPRMHFFVEGGVNPQATLTWLADGSTHNATIAPHNNGQVDGHLLTVRPPVVSETGLYQWELAVTDDGGKDVRIFGESPLVSWQHGTEPDAVFGTGWRLEGVPALWFVEGDSTPLQADQQDRFLLSFPGETPALFDAFGTSEHPSIQLGSVALHSQNNSVIGDWTGYREESQYGSLRTEGSYVVYDDGFGTEYFFTEFFDTDSNGDPVGGPRYTIERIEQPEVEYVQSAWDSDTARRGIEFSHDPNTHELTGLKASDGGEVSFSSTAITLQGITLSQQQAPPPSGQYSLEFLSDNLASISQLHAVNTTTDNVRTFTYNTSSFMTKDIWKDATHDVRVTEFGYDTYDRLTSVQLGEAGTDQNVLSYTVVSAATNLLNGADSTATVSVSPDYAAYNEQSGAGSTNSATLVTTSTFSLAGRLLQREEAYGGQVISNEQWSYDHLGSPSTYTDPVGRRFQSRYDYERHGNVTHTQDESTAEPLEHDLDAFRGNVVTTISPAGITRTEYETDPDEPEFGLPTRIIANLGDATPAITEYTYNDGGQLESLVRLRIAGNSYSEEWKYDGGILKRHEDARGLLTEYKYRGRQLETVTSTDDGQYDSTETTTYTHNALGFVDQVVTRDGNSTGQVISTLDYDYSAAGNLKQSRLFHGAITGSASPLVHEQYEYAVDGVVTATIDGNDVRSELTYDKAGLLTELKQAVGQSYIAIATGASHSIEQITTYSYYGDGSPHTETLADGTVRTYYLAPGGTTTQWVSISNVAGIPTIDPATDQVTLNDNQTMVTRTELDAMGRPSLERNLLTGSETSYIYGDARHNTPTQVDTLYVYSLDPTANTVQRKTLAQKLRYDGFGNAVVTLSLDDAGFPRPNISNFDELGLLTDTRVVAEYGASTTYLTLSTGEILKETETRRDKSHVGSSPPSTPTEFATRYQYDERGRVRQIKDPLAGVEARTDAAEIKHVYQKHDCPVPTQLPPQTQTPPPCPSHIPKVKPGWQKVISTSRDDIETVQWFDVAGRLVMDKNAYGAFTTFEYDVNGNVTHERFHPANDTNDVRTRHTQHFYDALNRRRATIQHGATPITSFTDYFLPVDSTAGWDMLITDPVDGQTATITDSLGQSILVLQSASDATGFEATGTLSSYDYRFPANGEAYSITTAQSGVLEPPPFTGAVRMEHDAGEMHGARRYLSDSGQVLRSEEEVRDAAGAGTYIMREEFGYDGYGRVLTASSSPTDETQRIGFTSTSTVTGGTFTVTIAGQTTSGIAYNANADAVRTKLEALSTVGTGNVLVTKLSTPTNDHEWQLTFRGGASGTNFLQATVDVTNLQTTGTATAVQATDIEGTSPDINYGYDDTRSGTGQVSLIDSPYSADRFVLYDSAGNRVQQGDDTAGTGETRIEWTYDALNRPTEETMDVEMLQSGGIWTETVTRTWDYGGLETTFMNRNDWTVVTTLDPAASTITEEVFEPGTNPSSAAVETTTTRLFSDGSTQELSNTDSSYTFEYDDFGRQDVVTSSFATLPGQTFTFDYDYDPLGRVTKRVLSSQGGSSPGEMFTTNYGFDTHNRLASLTQSGPQSLDKGVGFVYANYDDTSTSRPWEGGLVTEINRYDTTTVPATPDGSDVSHTLFTYTRNRQVEQIDHKGDGVSGHIRLHSYSYTNTGELSRYVSNTTPGSGINDDERNYTFDAANQLAHVQDDSGELEQNSNSTSVDFDYDKFGNREGTALPHYRLTDDVSGHYEYDKAGNVVRRWTYQYAESQPFGLLDCTNAGCTSDPFNVTAGTYSVRVSDIMIDADADPGSVSYTVKILDSITNAPLLDPITNTPIESPTSSLSKSQVGAPSDFTYVAEDIQVWFDLTSPPSQVKVRVFFDPPLSLGNPVDYTGNLNVARVDDLYQYTYDHNNRLVHVDEERQPDKATFGWNPPQWQSHSWDAEVDIVYDVLGNRIQTTVVDHVLSTNDRQVTVVPEHGRGLLEYDDQQRLEKHRLYAQGVDQVLAVEDFDFDPTTGAQDHNTTVWTLPDADGTLRDAYSANPRSGVQPVSHLDDDVFGAPLDASVAGGAIDDGIFTRFRGMDWIPELELFLAGDRPYDPYSGRMLSSSADAEAAGQNPYTFSGNSPVDRSQFGRSNEGNIRGMDSYTWGGSTWDIYTGYLGDFFDDPVVKTTVRGLQVVGGVVQLVGGAVFCPVTFGATCVIAARGLDDIQAGSRSLYHNEDINTATYELIKGSTGSDGWAFAGDLVTGLLSPGAAVKLVTTTGKAAKLARAGTQLARAGSKLGNAADATRLVRPVARSADDLGEGLGRSADDLAGHLCDVGGRLGTFLGNSFVPGTLVLMADGSTRAIEDIELGDWVLAEDPDTGERGARQVIDLIAGDGEKTLIDITIGDATITATDGHPFWVESRDAWIDADELRIGDVLLTDDGDRIAVSGIAEYSVPSQVVHNLTIADIHTYYVLVGQEPVLVHNCTVGYGRAYADGFDDAFRDAPTTVRTGRYGDLAKELRGTGQQANHLNQNAAFKSIIPEEEGLSHALRGNAFTEPGTPHFEFHRSLESFWSQYRRGGALASTRPTNAQYGQALRQALEAGRLSPAEAADLAGQAARQRAAHGLTESGLVPKVPGRLPQRRQ